MTETRIKRASRWLVALKDPAGLIDPEEISARTAVKAADQYITNNGSVDQVIVVYPLRPVMPVRDPAFFSQTMMPVMVPCEQPAAEDESG